MLRNDILAWACVLHNGIYVFWEGSIFLDANNKEMQSTPGCPCDVAFARKGDVSQSNQCSSYEEKLAAREYMRQMRMQKEEECCKVARVAPVNNKGRDASEITAVKMMKAAAVYRTVGTGSTPDFSSVVDRLTGKALGAPMCKGGPQDPICCDGKVRELYN